MSPPSWGTTTATGNCPTRCGGTRSPVPAPAASRIPGPGSSCSPPTSTPCRRTSTTRSSRRIPTSPQGARVILSPELGTIRAHDLDGLRLGKRHHVPPQWPSIRILLPHIWLQHSRHPTVPPPPAPLLMARPGDRRFSETLVHDVKLGSDRCCYLLRQHGQCPLQHVSAPAVVAELRAAPGVALLNLFDHSPPAFNEGAQRRWLRHSRGRSHRSLHLWVLLHALERDAIRPEILIHPLTLADQLPGPRRQEPATPTEEYDR